MHSRVCTTFFSSVFAVFMLLCLLELGFKVSTASAAEAGSGPRLPDLNGDGVIDMHDVGTCAHAFYSHPGDPNWNSTADLNYDDVVDMHDVTVTVKNFGKNCQGYDFNELTGWNVSSGNWSIQNGTLEGSSNNEGLIYAADATWKDCTFTVKEKFAAGSTASVGLVFCFSDPNNFYLAGIGWWGHKVSISKQVGGVWQELAFSGDIASVYTNVWYISTVKVSGSTIMLYLDGSLELSVNDSTFVLGSVGMRTKSSHVIIDYATVIGTLVTQGQPAHDVLYADGTKLRSPSGEEVTLVGMQIDYNVLNRDIWFNMGDVQKMKSYGGVVLELHILLFKDMMRQRGVIDQNWIDRLDRWVSWCEETQIYCIISFQNFEYTPWGAVTPVWFLLDKYPNDYPFNTGVYPWNKTTVNQASIDFWDTDNPLQEDTRQAILDGFQVIANRYKNDKYVLFGLFNEPFCLNDLVNYGNAEHLSITYARFVERIVDAIRSTGAKQLIFVDKPYCWFYTNHFEPVNRDGIVWEDHLYVWPDYDISQWKATVNEYVQRYVYDFQKPFYVGEYGFINSDGSIETHDFPNWEQVLQGEVNFLKTLPVCGYSWHEYPWLYGEYYNYVYNTFGADESEYILRTILG